jgi:hypothetical protein
MSHHVSCRIASASKTLDKKKNSTEKQKAITMGSSSVVVVVTTKLIWQRPLFYSAAPDSIENKNN